MPTVEAVMHPPALQSHCHFSQSVPKFPFHHFRVIPTYTPQLIYVHGRFENIPAITTITRSNGPLQVSSQRGPWLVAKTGFLRCPNRSIMRHKVEEAKSKRPPCTKQFWRQKKESPLNPRHSSRAAATSGQPAKRSKEREARGPSDHHDLHRINELADMKSKKQRHKFDAHPLHQLCPAVSPFRLSRRTIPASSDRSPARHNQRCNPHRK